MRKLIFFFTLPLACFSLSAQTAFFPEDSITNIYKLGEAEVVSSRASSLYNENKILSGKIGTIQMQTFNRYNLTEAINLLPGITITEAGGRNEGSFYLRGFNILQIPVFYDGIPIYVPYDGNVDINRFLTFDIAQITVSKGLTSVLYGPNTMGGAVNLISRKPVKKLEVQGISGLKFSDSGLNGYNTTVNVGSRSEKYYLLANISHIRNRFTSLSDKFEPGTNENGGRRENSETRDWKFSAKAGYTPNATDEYSLNFILQDARKGIPPPVEENMFRSYPEYNKKSIYFRFTTDLGYKTNLKVSAFYDNYYNIMDQYDDNTYTLQNTRRAFSSVYDDYSLGAFVNVSTEYFKNNVLKLSLYEKYDSHKEHNRGIPANTATGQNEVIGEPVQKYLDNTLSVGLEDVYTFNCFLDVVAGVSYNYRGNNKAQEYGTHYSTGEENVLFDFPTGSDNAFNYQLAAILRPAQKQELTISASRKSRFASQKERYSSKFGSQVPNPDLSSEFSWIFDITYKGELNSIFQYEISLFQNNLDDAIYQITQGKQEDGTAIYQNQNVGKAVFKGFEIALGVQPLKSIHLGMNYSYIQRKNKRDKSLKYTNVPKNKLILFGSYHLPGWDAYLHVDAEVNSKRYITSDGETLPGYALVNAKINSKVWKGISLEAGVRNLLDKNYFASINYPREGRTFFTSVVYDF